VVFQDQIKRQRLSWVLAATHLLLKRNGTTRFTLDTRKSRHILAICIGWDPSIRALRPARLRRSRRRRDVQRRKSIAGAGVVACKGCSLSASKSGFTSRVGVLTSYVAAEASGSSDSSSISGRGEFLLTSSSCGAGGNAFVVVEGAT
jgi:hypothetical protein